MGIPGKVRSTVLICDDDQSFRALVKATLEREFDVVEAGDGDEALRLARAAAPDLFVLDLKMPGRTGLEVMAELRADPVLAAKPVIMLTGHVEISSYEVAVDRGVSEYLPKPVSPWVLLSTAQALLSGNPREVDARGECGPGEGVDDEIRYLAGRALPRREATLVKHDPAGIDPALERARGEPVK